MFGTLVRRGAVIAAIAVALAGCGGAKATPITIYVTPTPAASAAKTPSATPTATPLDSPSAPASEVPTASPSPSPTPTPGTTLGGLTCTGTPAMQSYFADAAAALSFDVYCAVLPSSWWVQDTSYTVPSGGKLTILYKTNSGATLTVGEGNFCAGAPDCWMSASDLGTASFGDLGGTLKLRDSTPTYAVYVNAGTTHGYQIIGRGMSQSTFKSYAAGMIKVPKG